MTVRTKWRAPAAIGSAAIVITVVIVTIWYFAVRTAPGAPPPALARRPFAATSPWNTPITGAPAVDPGSAAMVKLLTTGANQAVADIDAYGLPIYVASTTDPTYSVRCTLPGVCPFSGLRVPVPDIAKTSTGTDHALVVVDTELDRIYEFWKANRARITGCTGSAPACYRWSVAWGAVEALDGNGGRSVSGAPGATGSGNSALAGVVRISELHAGSISHALSFVTHYTCAATFRYPAIKTDGRRTAPCIPEGTHIQLDPSIDVDAIPGITRGERAVAHALQTYGAYSRDTGGSNLAFVFESPIDGQPAIYKSVGFRWDYWNMPHIPWTSLRVLQH